MTSSLVPEGFKPLDVSDDFVGLIGPLWYKPEGDKLRVGLPLEKFAVAHGKRFTPAQPLVDHARSGKRFHKN